MKLILASGSPRRRELLGLYTAEFEVCPSAFDERAVHADNPAALAGALARGKCLAVAAQHPGRLELEGRVFGKPADAADAARMLRALSGRTHLVHTGVWVSDGERDEGFVDSCKVTFSPSRRRRSSAASPAANPSTRREPMASRAAPPSGWTGWKGITTPSWGCRSAAPCGCCTGLEAKRGAPKMKKGGKIAKGLVKTGLCDYNNERTGCARHTGGRLQDAFSARAGRWGRAGYRDRGGQDRGSALYARG